MKFFGRVLIFQVIVLAAAGAIQSARAEERLLVSRLPDRYDLNPYLSYLEDPDGTLTFDQIGNNNGERRWRKVSKTTVNFGYTASAFWFRLRLFNTEAESLDRLMEIAYPVLDHIDVYQAIPDGKVIFTRMGDKQPFTVRPIQARNFLVPIHLEANTPVDVFLRVQTGSSMQVPVRLWEERAWMARNVNDALHLGIFFGVMMIMGLYNLFVYISVRETYYLFYVCFVFCMIIFLAGINGLSFQYLWPGSVQWNDRSLIIGLAGVVCFTALFLREFINLPKNRPKSSRFTLAIAALALTIAAASFFLPYRLMIQTIILIAVIGILGAAIIALFRWRDGDIYARYFMAAWSAMMMGGVILAANKLNLIPRNLFTENATAYGMALQVIFLSIALAQRLNIEKQNTLAAQMEAYRQERIAREARENALKAQQRANARLEQRVRQRTLELQRANQQLETQSITDALTGIKNRRYFNGIYQQEFHRAIRDNTPLAVMMLDIDHFKDFNDTYGHLTGDECLKMVADIIQKALSRTSDMAFRYGGEEFCVLLPNTGERGAMMVAERIRGRIEAAEIQCDGRKASTTISIGVVSGIPSLELQPDNLIARADAALYQAKQEGRNRVVVHKTRGPLSGNE